jgi:digeranylgeranylglycerophospholipid reductase
MAPQDSQPTASGKSKPAGAGQKIAVIGGSAAGYYAASLLAQKGAAVRVFERNETLDPLPRTLIVTHHMRQILGAAGEASIVNEIRRFEIFTDGRFATVPLKNPDLIIERNTLIRSLAGQAKQAGADLEFGKRFHSLQPNSRGLMLEVERCSDGSREEVHADTVIGGDGAASRVGRAAGWEPVRTVPLMQAIVKLPKGMAQDTSRVWFVPQDTPYFYWLVPESATQGALGVIGESGPEMRRAFEAFLEKKGFEPIEFQGARIPVYSRWIPVHRQMGQGSVYLVGDAAGQVKVTTVGGIVTGLRGAMGVAEAILNGGPSRELRALRRELDLHLLLRRTMHEFKQADYSRLVDLLNDPTRRSLAEYSRDEAWKVLWRVCLQQPMFLWLGLRGLIMQRRPIAPPRP